MICNNCDKYVSLDFVNIADYCPRCMQSPFVEKVERIERNTLTSWADGFGLWHCRVEFGSHGYGNTGFYALERHWDSIRGTARRAMRREIQSRSALDLIGKRLRIEVEAQGIHASTNVWYSVTFKESI